MTTATQTRRPKMTAQDATHFNQFSKSSMLQICEAIAERSAQGLHPECTCEPYADTFTFNRWIAQGFCVRKGEKALRIATFTPTEHTRKALEEAQDGEQLSSVHLRPTVAFLFCRCQVDKK